MKNKIATCLICESSKLRILEKYSEDHLVKCQNCSFVFCGIKPSMADLEKHYHNYGSQTGLSPITVNRYHELLDYFEKYRQNNRILDIGCGNGYFLDEAKKRGWEVYGTEFNERQVLLCKQKGIAVAKGILDKNNYEKEFFDIITSFEVIEHINNPVEEVQNIDHILRSGGIFYVTTPNFNSISRDFLHEKWNIIEYPEHLSYYTPKTIKFLLGKVNFKCISLKTTGFSVQRLKGSISKAPSDNSVKTVNKKSQNSDEQLREKIESNKILQQVKSIVNSVLTITGKGDALKAIFVKN